MENSLKYGFESIHFCGDLKLFLHNLFNFQIQSTKNYNTKIQNTNTNKKFIYNYIFIYIIYNLQ